MNLISYECDNFSIPRNMRAFRLAIYSPLIVQTPSTVYNLKLYGAF